MTTKKIAKLRVCASCEWIFDIKDEHPEYGGCPKCEFVHYGARYVYGNKCYKYKETQEPWIDRKLDSYRRKLITHVEKTNENKKRKNNQIRI
jgi:hypothetical protein